MRDPWIKIWFNVAGPLPLALLDTYGLRGVHHIPDVDVEHLFREGLETCCNAPSQAEQIVAIALHKIIMQIAAVARIDHDRRSDRDRSGSRGRENLRLVMD